MRKKVILPIILAIVVIIAAVFTYFWFDDRSFSCVDNIAFGKGDYICGYLIDNSEILPESIPVEDINRPQSLNQFRVTGKIMSWKIECTPCYDANECLPQQQMACGQELKSIKIASIEEILSE